MVNVYNIVVIVMYINMNLKINATINVLIIQEYHLLMINIVNLYAKKKVPLKL